MGHSWVMRIWGLGLGMSLPLWGADWPQFRGPNRDGISAETGWNSKWPADGPKRLWRKNVGVGSSGVAISSGRLFTTGWTVERGGQKGTETLYCFDAETGAELWQQSYPADGFTHDHEGGSGATPTVANGRVYTLSRSGRLGCWDAATGKEIWRKDLVADFGGKPPFYGYGASPFVFDGKVVVTAGGKDGSTLALDTATGATHWKSGKDEAAYATPVLLSLRGSAALAVFNFAGLVVMDAADGRELSRQPWTTMSPRRSSINASTPVADGSRLFLSSGYGVGCALLDVSSHPPALIWRNQNLVLHYTTPVLYNGHLYGFHTPNEWFGEGALRCVRWTTGEVVWEHARPGWGSLIVADGKLIILGRRGELIVANAAPEGYRELARAQVLGGTTRAEPVLSQRRLYLKNVAGELSCYDLR